MSESYYLAWIGNVDDDFTHYLANGSVVPVEPADIVAKACEVHRDWVVVAELAAHGEGHYKVCFVSGVGIGGDDE